jgi:hypothetical protein
VSPSVEPTPTADGGVALDGAVVPDITAGLDAVPDELPHGNSVPLPSSANHLPQDVKTQLVRALSVRKWLDDEIHRINYLIDNNLTKNAADVVRLNRLVRVKRELESAMRNMVRQFNIPPDALKLQR